MPQIIFTKHLESRLKERGLDLDLLRRTIRFPDSVINSRTSSAKKYIKTLNNIKFTAVTKKQGSDLIIVSAWHKLLSPHQLTRHKKPFLEKLIYNLITRLEQSFRR